MQNNYPIIEEELNYIKFIDRPFSQTLWNFSKGRLKVYLNNFRGTWERYHWKDSEMIEKWQSSPEVLKWHNILSKIKWNNEKQKIIKLEEEAEYNAE